MDVELIRTDIVGAVDSGNTLFCLPSMVKSVFMEKLKNLDIDCLTEKEKNESFEQLKCKLKNFEKLGNLTITIENQDFNLNLSQLKDDCDEKECFIKLEFYSGGMLIIGQPFLKKFKTSFNLDDQTLAIEVPDSDIKVVELESY